MIQTWGGGQLLAFSGLDGPTDYERGLVARTAKDGTTAVEIMLPARVILTFDPAPPLSVDLTGDTLHAQTNAGDTRLVFADAHHLLVEGRCSTGDVPEGLSAAREGARLVVGSTSRFDRSWLRADFNAVWSARRAWLSERGYLVAGAQGARARTALKCLSVMKTQVCAPEGRLQHLWTTPDRWPHRNIWLWDSAFHAIGWRHVDPAAAREMLLAVLDTQQPDGRIPISSSPVADSTSPFTQPPVLTLAASLVDAVHPDDAWIERIYPSLRRYLEWDLANRDSDGAGLVEWAIEGSPMCRSGESGADNSSRFDAATRLDAPDFNAMIALEAELLAQFASRLGRSDDAVRLQAIRDRLCAVMNRRLWDEERGIYMDAGAETGTRTGILSCAGFLPLICGAASTAQAAMLAAHLENPDTFGRPLPVPSIAPLSGNGYAKDMWRGPVWVNINWLIEYGLRRYGYHALADRIVRQTCKAIEAAFDRHGCIFEYYDDEGVREPPDLDRKGPCNPEEWIHQVIHDYGWSSTLYVDWVCRARKDRA